MDKQALKKLYYSKFARTEDELEYYFAPGRVCLLGEHLDYNGGTVITATISKGIYAVVRKTTNKVLWMHSSIDNKDVVVPLNEPIKFDTKYGWGNYPLGVLSILQGKGLEFEGAEILFYTDLPIGAGLSSSACIMVLMAFIFNPPKTDEDYLELAKIAKQAENEFVGLQCGIMDQCAISLGRQNGALLLNCNNLAFDFAPLQLNGAKLVILNSNKKRTLTESNFNKRTEECKTAYNILAAHKSIETLADADDADVHTHIKDETIKKRALHVTVEQKRVQHAKLVLAAGDYAAFGALMNESHQSLKNHYEVTGKELDALAESAAAHAACLGAKMTGAGFGGCVVALVKKDELDDFTNVVLEKYTQKTGLIAEAHIVSLSGSVKRLTD